MNNQWNLETHGDPLGRVRETIRDIWNQAELDGMLVTLSEGNEANATPRFITDMTDINNINPFKPLMEINIARVVPVMLAEHPGGKIGAVLRPCEMRALIEITKHTSLKIDNLLTISVDCLGTLPADEYQWRLERADKALAEEPKSSEPSDELAREALRFARQGGIVPYRYRSACQVCTSPAAGQAMVNLHILGLPVRQKMLLSMNTPTPELRAAVEQISDGEAGDELVQQHDRILSKMSERHLRTMDRLNEGLGGLLPVDVEAVIRLLESCGDCQNCMNVCPICSLDRPQQSADGHYDQAGVARWLVSCAGCGMCEQACPNHMPIAALFAFIRQQLDLKMDYMPGRSFDEPLPLI